MYLYMYIYVLRCMYRRGGRGVFVHVYICPKVYVCECVHTACMYMYMKVLLLAIMYDELQSLSTAAYLGSGHHASSCQSDQPLLLCWFLLLHDAQIPSEE